MTRIQYLLVFLVLVLGFWVRLYKIDNPVADWHSWRQADTAAVTRNFVKTGLNLFSPRYDDFSDVSGRGLFNPSGYRLVEFPLFNLIHYLLFVTFGSKPLEFWGRMTSILASLCSSLLIFALVRRRSGFTTALLSQFFFLSLPFNIYFSRVILPDPLMVTMYLTALNFFDLWLSHPAKKLLLATAVAGGLAVLVKPVALFFLVIPIFWQLWLKYHRRIFRQWHVYLLFAAFALPFFIWRIWEHQHPEGIPASIWLLNGDHIRFKGAFFRWIFGERIGNMILGNWGIYPFATGIISLLTGPGAYFFPFVIAAVTYLFTFASGNVRHDYYQIPVIPIIAILLAHGFMFLWKAQASLSVTWGKRILATVSVLFMLGFSWYTIRGNFQVNHWEIIKAGAAVDRLVPQEALVIANYNGDTAFLYHTNRAGFPNIPFPVKDLIDRYGIEYYVSVNYDDQTRAIMKKYIVIEEVPEYVIVKLEEPRQK